MYDTSLSMQIIQRQQQLHQRPLQHVLGEVLWIQSRLKMQKTSHEWFKDDTLMDTARPHQFELPHHVADNTAARVVRLHVGEVLQHAPSWFVFELLVYIFNATYRCSLVHY